MTGASRESVAPPERSRSLHRLSVVVLCVLVVVSVAAALGVAKARANSVNQSLDFQVSQVRGALQAAMPSIQEPLIAASRIATEGGSMAAFTSYMSAEVGVGAPFRSVALWRVSGGTARLVLVEGARPELLSHPAASTSIARVAPSANLTVSGLLGDPVRVLGFSERLPSGSRGYVVYAESVYPLMAEVPGGPGSVFSGLHFALFLGRGTRASALIERSVSLPVTGPHRTQTVAFGNSTVTILASDPGASTGVASDPVVWMVLLAGLLVALVATTASEGLLRRHRATELRATASDLRYGEQRDIAETLQRAMLPEQSPIFEGLEIATTYVPGVRGLEVGGDWYDAISVDSDHLFITVGDVSGRGLQAASMMSYLRHSIRAFALQGDGPALVVTRLGSMVDIGRDEHFATVLCALIDVPRRIATIVSAGHPPPLIVDHSGARLAQIFVNPPLGVTVGTKVTSSTLSVEPGTALIAYTDGLVERRGHSIDAGFARLVAAVPPAGGSIVELVDLVVSSMGSDAGADDVAVLGVKWLAAPATTRPETVNAPAVTRSRRFARGEDSPALARQFVAEALGQVDPSVADAAVLLTSELATNAVFHAGSGFDVDVDVDGERHRVRVGVSDHGGGEVSVGDPRPEEPHGRGLQIVATMADRWGVESTPNGSTKTVWFELRTDVTAELH